MAQKLLNSRLQLKHDTAVNWSTSTLVLMAGEFAFETDTGKFKIGDGSKTFPQLGYATLTPDEISSALSTNSVQSVSLSSGTNNGTLKLTVDGTDTDNIAVTGLGSAAFTPTTDYATADQGALATNAVRTVATGTTNGTISVKTGAADAVEVPVAGLGSAAFTETSAYATAAQGGKADTAVQAVEITSGTNNGTIKLTVDGTDTDNISVTGLGSAAFTESSAYATAAQGAKADTAMQPNADIVMTGSLTLAGNPSTDNMAANKKYVDDQISSSIAASDAMVFRGTLGTGGTVAALPTEDVVQGDTYKVISDISVGADVSSTGAAVSAKPGDLVVSLDGTKWIVVPSGDEIVTTVAISANPNVDSTARSGSVTLGDAAQHTVATSIAAADTSVNLPTAAAVASFVEGKNYVTTDEFVTNTPNSSTKFYLTGTTSATESTAHQIFDTNVYVDAAAGKLVATEFHGALKGNADTATTLETARTIALSGAVTGTATSFDGSANIIIDTTAINTDYITNGTNEVVWDCGGAA